MAKDKDLKFEVWAHFKDSQHVFIATEQNGQPRVRPVTLVFSDQRFWVLTGTNNAKIQRWNFAYYLREEKKSVT